METAVASHVGHVRTENQDAYGRFPEGDGAAAGAAAGAQLFVVADGMGGHVGGREASETAVRVVAETFFERAAAPPAERLEAALWAANERIHARSGAGAAFELSGTTCTALAWVEQEVFVAHVGDSRAYRVTSDGLDPLTRLHTWAAEMCREGILTAAEAAVHPRRHTLTRALGTHPDVEVDVRRVGPPAAGDVFLLCTDGLAPVPEEVIHGVVRKYAPDDACRRLVQLANDRGGHDNVTVVLVRFR